MKSCETCGASAKDDLRYYGEAICLLCSGKLYPWIYYQAVREGDGSWALLRQHTTGDLGLSFTNTNRALQPGERFLLESEVAQLVPKSRLAVRCIPWQG